ncbi:nuclear transport factor 2 family protein [Streptomyces sp. NPDC014872]|uniref:nuclear transport factor 2 family protein n=1 Tax=Streptomyces sp. NPDC014872 TaxID=3364926 RepID=UPI0036FA3163
MADAHPHAYEARDPDAFEARFTPTEEVWSEGSVLASGRDELRDLYAHQFATPEISAVGLSRAAVGDRVVDVERLTCTGTDPIRALVAYRVQGHLIDEMRLLTLPPEPLLPRAPTPDGHAPPRLSPPGGAPAQGTTATTAQLSTASRVRASWRRRQPCSCSTAGCAGDGTSGHRATGSRIGRSRSGGVLAAMPVTRHGERAVRVRAGRRRHARAVLGHAHACGHHRAERVGPGARNVCKR